MFHICHWKLRISDELIYAVFKYIQHGVYCSGVNEILTRDREYSKKFGSSRPPLKRLRRYKIMREFSASLVTPRRQYKRRDLFRVPRGLDEETEFCITPSVRSGEGKVPTGGLDLPTTITAQKSLSQSLARAFALALTSFCAFRLAKHQSQAQALRTWTTRLRFLRINSLTSTIVPKLLSETRLNLSVLITPKGER